MYVEIFATIGSIIGAVVIFKLYLLYVTGWCKSYSCLIGKTAIVTGANSGIGYYTALDLAKRGCKIILACRDKTRAEIARDSIVKETGNQNIIVMLIDMQSLESIKNFAKEFNENEERLDILVNNAGAVGLGDKFTNDGLQITMQTNYLSSVLLTHLLLDKLKASAPSRIVNVSSKAAAFSMMKIDDLNKSPRFLANIFSYSNSKLCNILYTIELAKVLQDSGVTVNVLHPGAVATPAIRTIPGVTQYLFRLAAFLFYKTSEAGAQTTIYLCVAKEVENVTGGLFEDCDQVSLYWTARNEVLAKEVWNKSRELLHI